MPTRTPNKWQRTQHQQRVEEFMELAKQELPNSPTEPSVEVRLLRAKLILEEALETIQALGVAIFIEGYRANLLYEMTTATGCHLAACDPFNMVEAVDGCCDLSVVTIGTLSALGVADAPLIEAVDRNNLEKFGPGHTIREDGKLVKPPGHKPPDITAELVKQGWPDPINEMDPTQ